MDGVAVLGLGTQQPLSTGVLSWVSSPAELSYLLYENKPESAQPEPLALLKEQNPLQGATFPICEWLYVSMVTK